MKRNLFMTVGAAVIFGLAFFSYCYSEGKAPVIADLSFEWVDSLKVNETRNLIFKFTSDSRPDDVLVWFYGVIGRGLQNIVRSYKEKELTVKITDKGDGTFEIVAQRDDLVAPKSPTRIEAALWIVTGKEKSNQLKTTIELSK